MIFSKPLFFGTILVHEKLNLKFGAMRTIITFVFLVAFIVKSEASELYLRIASSGDYVVTVFDQVHQNKSNIYKFSGLPNGINSILVVNKYTNMVLYNGTITLLPNERIVAEINTFGQFSIRQKVQIQEVNWYTVLENNNYPSNPYPNNPYPNHPPHPHNPYPGAPNNSFPNNYVDDNTFNLFLQTLKDESFDSNKLKMAKNYASKSALSAQQILKVCKEFTFDSNRLDFAKSAYVTCYDKNNYFLLKNAFDYSSSYNSLLEYTEKQ